MSWRVLAKIFFSLTEFVAFLLLLSVPDVPTSLFLVIVAAYVWRFTLAPLSPKLSVLISVAIIFSAGLAIFYSNLSQGGVLGPALILLHANLTLVKGYSAFRYWRLGIAFLEVLLAAVLYPEVQMFLGIFVFVLLASLSMSFGFLQLQIAAAKADIRQNRASLKLVGQLFLVSTLIFLTSLAIFPLLPRSNWGGLGSQSFVNPGYAETISLINSSLQWGRGKNEPLVTVSLSEDSPRPLIIPFGLLRMTVLDLFDGNEWLPKGKKSQRLEFSSTDQSPKIMATREKITSAALPVPYFFEPQLRTGERIQKSEAGEWFFASFYHAKVNYGWREIKAGLSDPPIMAHLGLPKGIRADEFLERFFSNAPKKSEALDRKVGWIQSYFSGFSYDLDYQVPKNPEQILSNFLKEKSGHCELFATATALYFRSLGVPSRLVTGFRVGGLDKDLTVVRSSQAHAWVEVWDERRGLWIPLDFTPPAPASSAWTSWFQDLYDLAFAYWNRYVLSFDWGNINFSAVWKSFSLIVFFLLSGWGWRRLKRNDKEVIFSTRPNVSAIWDRVAKEVGRRGFESQEIWTTLAPNQRPDYLRLRFSREEPSSEELHTFESNLRSEIWQSLEAKERESFRR